MSRAAAWLLLAWTGFGIAAAAWGYWSIMDSCPSEEGFAGCFEPPYRFAATVSFLLWFPVEVLLLTVWLVDRFGGRGR